MKKNIFKNKKEIDNENKYRYIQTLLNPEKYGGIKAPDNKKVPTVTLQLRTRIALKLDPLGQVVLKITPFFLIDHDIINYAMPYEFQSTSGIEDFYFHIRELGISYTNGYYDGEPRIDMTTIINQMVESSLYTHYRLVSGSVSLKYIGALKDAQGLIGGGISFAEEKPALVYGIASNSEEDPGPMPTVSSFVPGEDNDELIEKIRHMQYNRENSSIEGIKLLYFPIDKSYLNFLPLPDRNNLKYKLRKNEINIYPYIEVDENYYKRGFNWYIYVDGGIANASNYFLDICCNFECIVAAKMLIYVIPNENDYMISEKELIEILNKIRDNCINKLI